MEYYLAIKKNKIMPFAATWMQYKILILSYAICSNTDAIQNSHPKSERERQMPHVTYKWNLKYGTNEPIYKTETDSQT